MSRELVWLVWCTHAFMIPGCFKSIWKLDFAVVCPCVLVSFFCMRIVANNAAQTAKFVLFQEVIDWTLLVSLFLS